MSLVKLNITRGVTGTLPTSNYTSGITEADMYRVTTSFTGDAEPIASNWERVDTNNFSKIGTGISQSSGIFTFPSTGVYLIRMKIFSTSNSDTGAIFTTTNNSTYGNASQSDEQNAMCEFLFDVTDTSTHKVKFKKYGGTGSLQGSTAENSTTFTFIRMGDT